MKQGEVDLTKALKRGLRRFETSPRNSPWLLECYNLAPAEDGLEPHETLVSLGASGISWGGEGQYTPSLTHRDITIRITDYVDLDELQGVTVTIDGTVEGTTDSNGELVVSGISVGGHELVLTKSGYSSSGSDDLLNDYIMII